MIITDYKGRTRYSDHVQSEDIYFTVVFDVDEKEFIIDYPELMEVILGYLTEERNKIIPKRKKRQKRKYTKKSDKIDGSKDSMSYLELEK